MDWIPALVTGLLTSLATWHLGVRKLDATRSDRVRAELRADHAACLEEVREVREALQQALVARAELSGRVDQLSSELATIRAQLVAGFFQAQGKL